MPASQVSEFQMGTPKAMNDARAMQESENNRGAKLVTQARQVETDELIYVYNILAGWDFPPVTQPPTFPHFKIPICPKDKEFAYTTLPRYVNEPYEKPNTTEIMYTQRSGTEAANSLLNPDSHPGNPWDAQFRDITRFGNQDQSGNNLNAFGVFWSFTKPDDLRLVEEIKRCRQRVDSTMRALVDAGEQLNAANNRKDISPLMHFAMEYFNLQAGWHQSHAHMIPCPVCGDSIRESLAYHKNAMGDRCIIDWQRTYAAGVIKREDVPVELRWWEEEEPEPEPVAAAPAPRNKAKGKTR